MQWARSMGVSTMANKKTLFVVLVGHAERIEAYLSLFFVDFDIVIAMIACYIRRVISISGDLNFCGQQHN